MIIKILCHFPKDQLLKFATENLQDNSGNWQNKIIAISSLSRNIGEDKSYEISGMSIELDDNDRFFRTMMSGDNRYISGKKVEIRAENDSTIYIGTVEKWQFKEDTFILFINDKLSGLETLIPEIITKTKYPNMAEKADGQSIPLIYGTHNKTGKGAVKCWRVDENIFLLAGHHCAQFYGDAYTEDGSSLSILTLDNNADQYSYLQTSSTSEDFIYANVQGKVDESANLIEDPIDVLKDIIDNYTDMTYDNTGMENAAAIMANRNYKISCVVDNQKNLQDVLKEFSFSFDCDFFIGKGNEVMISMLKWSDLKPAKLFTQNQIFDFKMEEQPEGIRNKVKYQYEYNQAYAEYQKLPVYTLEESVAGWGEFYNRNEPLDLRYVWDDSSAFDVVQRYVIQHKNPRRIANLEVPLSEFIGLDISDIIEIQHPGAIDINIRKYQIRRTNIDFLGDSVQLEATDITTLTGGVFLLGNRDELTDKWENADDNERAFGYLADRETGYFEGGTDYGKVLY